MKKLLSFAAAATTRLRVQKGGQGMRLPPSEWGHQLENAVAGPAADRPEPPARLAADSHVADIRARCGGSIG